MIGEVIKEKDGKIKVYFFYKKENTGKSMLYAYTRTKSMYKKFKEERNMDCFTIRKEYIDKYIWDELDKKYGDSMIVIEPFDSYKGYVNLAVTIRENNMVSDICENMIDKVISIVSYFQNYVSLKKEYCDAIKFIYNNITKNGYEREILKLTGESCSIIESNLDTLKILIEVAHDTFFVNGKE